MEQPDGHGINQFETDQQSPLSAQDNSDSERKYEKV
jgi:hypothetical protein